MRLRVPIQKVNQKVTKYKNVTKVPLNLPVLVACSRIWRERRGVASSRAQDYVKDYWPSRWSTDSHAHANKPQDVRKMRDWQP